VSGADLARASNTTPQTMNGVLASLERGGLVERHPHPTHGRILRVTLTDEGLRRLEAANPAVRELERAIEKDVAPEHIAVVKEWLVEAARRLDEIAAEGPPPVGGRGRRPRRT
jgi:DNA-binding MarR family transcriptional regulator